MAVWSGGRRGARRTADVRVLAIGGSAIYRTFAERTTGHRFLALSSAERDGVVEMNRLYGEWLRAAADAHGQPWVTSRPWTSLPERVLQKLR
jgi:hypothetical protein